MAKRGPKVNPLSNYQRLKKQRIALSEVEKSQEESWTPQVLAYMASIVDQSSFSVNAKGRFVAKLVFTTRSALLIQWIVKHFGGHGKTAPVIFNRRVRENRLYTILSYKWHASTAVAIRVISRVLPYQVAKIEHSNLLLAFEKTRIDKSYRKGQRGDGGAQYLTHAIIEERIRIGNAMLSLNGGCIKERHAVYQQEVVDCKNLEEQYDSILDFLFDESVK